jgi:hypothetical protein
MKGALNQPFFVSNAEKWEAAIKSALTVSGRM